MVRSCSALGCSRRQNRKSKEENITFHMFPKDQERRSRWVKAMFGPGADTSWQPVSSSMLCSNHFKEGCFDRTGQIVRLRDDAEPTIFVRTGKAVMSSEKRLKRLAQRTEDVAKEEMTDDPDESEEDAEGNAAKKSKSDACAHSGEGVKCPLCCGESLVSVKALQAHLRLVVSRLRCPICRMGFKEVTALVQHVAKEHPCPEDDEEELEQTTPQTVDLPQHIFEGNDQPEVLTFFFTGQAGSEGGGDKGARSAPSDPEVAWCIVNDPRLGTDVSEGNQEAS